jgi:menaquinone-dependent protoporphyrinogen oxidase
MRVLVTAASKYGATLEIAQAIGDELTRLGHDVATQPLDDVSTVDGYDAVVVGSAVYAGHWLKTAKAFVETHAGALRGKAVWLFSSGPIGDPPTPTEDPVDAAALVAATDARAHHVFAGKLDRAHLVFVERAVATALRAPYGDFRQWSEVRGWAAGIAAELDSTSARRH